MSITTETGWGRQRVFSPRPRLRVGPPGLESPHRLCEPLSPNQKAQIQEAGLLWERVSILAT